MCVCVCVCVHACVHMHRQTHTCKMFTSGLFQEIVLIAVGVGMIFTIIFHIGTKEESCDQHVYSTCSSQSYGSTDETYQTHRVEYLQPISLQSYTWMHWLKEYRFYLVGIFPYSIPIAFISSVGIAKIYLSFFIFIFIQIY